MLLVRWYMKQLFLGLIALNLCFLLFQQFSGADDLPAVAKTAPPAGGPTDATEPPVSVEPPVAVAGPIGAPEVTRSGGLVSVDIGNSLALASAAGSVAPSATGPAIGSAADSTAAATNSALKKATASPAAPPAQVADNSAAANCVIAGPFRRRSQAEQVVDQLAKADVEATLQPRDVALLPDYMVYVGPQASVGEARKLDATFKAAKRDSQIIASGSLRNALSLGVFSRGALARELQAEMQAAGYTPKIVTITRNRRGFQVLTQLTKALRAQFVQADTPFIDCPQTIAQR